MNRQHGTESNLISAFWLMLEVTNKVPVINISDSFAGCIGSYVGESPSLRANKDASAGRTVLVPGYKNSFLENGKVGTHKQ